ncbi:purine-nucleoside phosphorylase [Desulfogranum mediterraneum]|uniref:purine-nucleoside phosphorylase n=1 Tax=Desulfogranum mediterraneum TaxID=160661 RepID=UPI0004133FFE|nr:purine-nucleoside phosphorylase [Desulfogranum mediterraneum]
MTTPHINAQAGAFAETVLLPGDPLRARYIAETFLEEAKLVSDVRNMLGFTGSYQGKSISVMGSGMGIPSCSIYATELIREYGVKNLIRVGSCGAVGTEIKLEDVIIAMGASTDSKVNRVRFKGHDFAALASFELLRKAVSAAEALAIPVRIGNVFTSDLFYTPEPEIFELMEKYNILGVEMEAAGLYGVAAEFAAKAVCLLTVSDHIATGERATFQERQTGFDRMLRIALETALAVE